MKIFNFSNFPLNYHQLDHNSEIPFFVKPETAILKNNIPFFYPDFTKDLRCCIAVVIKIGKLGKCIKEKFAPNYYNELSLCINFIANDNLIKLSDNGLPWDKAVSFDNSSAIGNFIQFANLNEYSQLKLSLLSNFNFKAEFCLFDLPISINKAIAIISTYYTLKIGDFIVIEAPYDYVPLQIGHLLSGFVNNDKILEIKIK